MAANICTNSGRRSRTLKIYTRGNSIVSTISNLTIDELEVGKKVSYSKTCSAEDVRLFARISGDINPVHLDEDYAKKTQFGRCIAHGMYTAALVSAAVALKLPGPGSIYLGQDMKFRAPVFIDDTIRVELEVESIREDKPIVGLKFSCLNQDGKIVATGTAVVLAPTEKVTLDSARLA
jgi:3-hydroxybutyryl-CoA dehydratase